MLFKRIKKLRKEKKWSQLDLADKIGVGSHVISRYENGRITPSAESIIKLAEAFDVSTDYLLFENATKKPFKFEDPELTKRLEDIDALDEKDKTFLFEIVDTLIAKKKMKEIFKKSA